MLDRRIGGYDFSNLPYARAIRAFPCQQSSRFASEKDGDCGKQQCDEQGSGGIKVWVVERVPEKNTKEGNEHSGEPGAVFKENGEDSGIFATDDFVPC